MGAAPRATGRSKFAEPDVFRMCDTACIYRMLRPGTIQGMQIAFLASALAVAFSALCAFLFIRDADHHA